LGKHSVSQTNQMEYILDIELTNDRSILKRRSMV
jgi:hypothetical protein